MQSNSSKRSDLQQPKPWRSDIVAVIRCLTDKKKIGKYGTEGAGLWAQKLNTFWFIYLEIPGSLKTYWYHDVIKRLVIYLFCFGKFAREGAHVRDKISLIIPYSLCDVIRCFTKIKHKLFWSICLVKSAHVSTEMKYLAIHLYLKIPGSLKTYWYQDVSNRLTEIKHKLFWRYVW